MQYCKDLKQWPDSWAGSDRDIPIGTAILAEFECFLLDRVQKGQAQRTIKRYARYLWALGGELIRQVNYDEQDRNLSGKNLILKYIDGSGGPLWRHADDPLDHRRYDSVCIALYKSIVKPA